MFNVNSYEAFKWIQQLYFKCYNSTVDALVDKKLWDVWIYIVSESGKAVKYLRAVTPMAGDIQGNGWNLLREVRHMC